MLDLNNVQIADLLSDFLEKKHRNRPDRGEEKAER
jgi:hypothetical protein